MKSVRKNVKKEDVLTILREYQKTIFTNKPSVEKMMDEIRMMNFRVRPINGDISAINGMDIKLIEMIWNLGKLDELYRGKERLLNQKDRKLFVKFFQSIHERFQKELGYLKLVRTEDEDNSTILEMEVFREIPRKRKIN